MTQENRPKIIFVDSESRLFSKINILLYNNGFQVYCETNPRNCLKMLTLQNCDLLITNCKMPGMNGIELLKAAKRLIPWLPVLIINGSSRDIPTIVKAIKEGAVDVLKKPFNEKIFLQTVKNIIKNNRENILLYHSLTVMEKKVLKLILLGKNCRESAVLLGCKKRTIEEHHRNLRKKFGVHNIMSIIGQVAQSGLVKFPKEPDS